MKFKAGDEVVHLHSKNFRVTIASVDKIIQAYWSSTRVPYHQKYIEGSFILYKDKETRHPLTTIFK